MTNATPQKEDTRRPPGDYRKEIDYLLTTKPSMSTQEEFDEPRFWSDMKMHLNDLENLIDHYFPSYELENHIIDNLFVDPDPSGKQRTTEEVLKTIFDLIVSSESCRYIDSFLSNENLINYGTLDRNIKSRYLSFRETEPQNGYSRFLLRELKDVMFHAGMCEYSLGTIESKGIHHFFGDNLMKYKANYRVDELLKSNLRMLSRNLSGMVEDAILTFTPKEFNIAYGDEYNWMHDDEYYFINGRTDRSGKVENTFMNETKNMTETKNKYERFSLKQQLIILDKLGFKEADVWSVLAKEKKAKILSKLLNRNEQDIRAMLTYWGITDAQNRYNTSNVEDNKKVSDFLQVNLT